MSDERLRALERQWRDTGEVTHEVALLRERLRVGALAMGRLELAARLGHFAAAQALDREPGSTPIDETFPLADLVASAGTAACSRAGLAIAEATVDQVEPSMIEAASDGLAALRAHVLGQRAAAGDIDTAARLLTSMSSPRPRSSKAGTTALEIVNLAIAIGIQGRRVARSSLRRAFELGRPLMDTADPRRVVCRELAPWLLHESIPDEALPTEPLLIIEQRFEIPERGTIVLPEVDLAIAASDVAFAVELRLGSERTRCVTKASIPLTQPPRSRALHALLLPLRKAQVPVEAEIWEVGP